MADARSTSSKSGKTDATLAQVLKDFNSAWEYTSGSWHQRWQDNYSLYNNKRVKVGYQGITDSFVPICFGTVETLTSALFGTKPKFNFVPPQDKQDQKTDILNGLVDFFWDKDQWSLKVINTGRTGLMLGTAIDYWYWDNDHPCMLNVALRDYFRDPFTPGGEEPRFQGRRYLTTKEELESFEVVDLEDVDVDDNPTGNMKKKYTNLNKIPKDGQTGENTDKQEKDMWYGSTVEKPEENQIEVIEYWTNDRVVSIANRCVVIQDEENPFKAKARLNGAEYPKGIMPFNWFRDYVDPSLFYAKGEIDFLADQQELLNDITNQNNDAITYTLNQMYTLDPKYADRINEVENLPGAVYPFEKDALMPIQQRPIPSDAFNERMNIKNEMRETSGSSEVVRGVKSDSDATATEVNAQIAGAGQRIGLKITQIENEYFHRMARIVFELIKLYVTEPMMVRILGKDAATWEEFDPREFQGDYEPRVQLDIEIESKKEKESAMAKEMLAAFLNDPDINQQELKKMVLQRSFNLDPDEVEGLIQVMPPMGMGMPGEMPPEEMMAAGMEGGPVDPMTEMPVPTPEEMMV